jgi:hypothetical protein
MKIGTVIAVTVCLNLFNTLVTCLKDVSYGTLHWSRAYVVYYESLERTFYFLLEFIILLLNKAAEYTI